MQTTEEIRQWRVANPNKRINLSDANLCHANLRGANLRGANLWHANLRDADLRDTELSENNMSGVIGITVLNTGDPRGYVLYVQGDNVGAGCRYFTKEEAFEHWGPDYKGLDRAIGDMYINALNRHFNEEEV
jgi:uncharacterized protein YjbI with pentapeptide repeats